MIYQIFVRYAIVGILIHGKEPVTELVLETSTVLNKEVNNHSSAALQSLIDHIRLRVMNSPETLGKIVESVIKNPGFIVPDASLLKLK